MTKQTAVDPNAQADSLKMMQEPPRQREFFLIGPDLRGGGKGHGVILENEDRLVMPPYKILCPHDGRDGGFPPLPEKPRLVLDTKRGNMPRDLELFGSYWLVSERLKDAFEKIDPRAFEFVDCEFFLPDGIAGPTTYMCSIVQEIDALILDKSRVKIIQDTPDHQIYSISGYFDLVFDERKIGQAHIFRQPRLGGGPICDSIFKYGIDTRNFEGIRFRRVKELPPEESIQ